MTPRPVDDDRAADLLERLLTDPGFRRDFRRDPAAACTAAGLGDLAAEIKGEAGGGAAFQTLEVRESKSALAGMVLAAAAEGIAAVHLLEHMSSQGGDAHAAGIAHSALTRASVRALPVVQGNQADPLAAAPEAIGGGAIGSGVSDQAAALASQVLADPHVHLSPAAEMAFSQQGVDPRVDSLLLGLSQSHQITVGSVSGPGTVSIVAVDGVPVSGSNIGARDLVEHLAAVDPSAQPAKVSTPWNINGPHFTSGPEHSNQIELSYDAAVSPDAASLPGSGAEGQAVVHEAARFLGKPYVWGGESPNSGFDCSGLVQYSYRQLGIDLPRTTWDQIKVGHAVEWGHFQPGDLIFSNFEGPGAGASHVVIYAGNGQVIAAPHTGGHVEYEPVSWFKDYFVGARRVIPGEGGGGAMPADAALPADAAMPAGTGAGQADAAVPPGATISTPAAGAEQISPTPGAGVHNTVQFMPAVPADHAASVADVMTYPGDGASRQQIAEWMATAARKAGLPPELPVMAALVESGLKNDQFGDRDSLGFFQMRTSIWDEGPYKGFAQNPDLQLKWFIDQAVALKQRRLSEGYSGYGNDPAGWGNWVADIERPAEQYRGRYQLQLETARGLLGDNA